MIEMLIGFYLAMIVLHYVAMKYFKVSGFTFGRFFYFQKKKDYSNNLSVEFHSNSDVMVGAILTINAWHASLFLCFFGDLNIVLKLPKFFTKFPQFFNKGREYGFAITKAKGIMRKNLWSFMVMVGQNKEGSSVPIIFINTKDLLLGKEKYKEDSFRKGGKRSLLLPEGEYWYEYKTFRATTWRLLTKKKSTRMIRVEFFKAIPMPNNQLIKSLYGELENGSISKTIQREINSILILREKLSKEKNWKPNK